MTQRHYFLFLALISLQLITSQEQVGLASVRPLAHEGIKTESNVFFSHDSLFASHRTISFGEIVKVTNLNNLRTVELKITDRGPFIKNRIIDLSQRAAFNLGISQGSVANVKIELLPDDTVIPYGNYPIDTRDFSKAKTVKTDNYPKNEYGLEISKDNTPKESNIQKKPAKKENVTFTAKVTSISYTEDKPTEKSKPQTTKKTIQGDSASNADIKEATTTSEEEKPTVKELDQNVKQTLENLDINTSPSTENTGTASTESEFSSNTLKAPVRTATTLENHTGDFSLQVGSFLDKVEATDYAKILLTEKKVYNVKVFKALENGKPVYKIYVGRYIKLKYANAYKEQLQAKAIEAFVVPID